MAPDLSESFLNLPMNQLNEHSSNIKVRHIYAKAFLMDGHIHCYRTVIGTVFMKYLGNKSEYCLEK